MILVFGKTGQVGAELQLLPNILALGRDEVDLTHPGASAAAIHSLKPQAVINAAAYTNVDLAEEREPLATIVNAQAPAEMAQACLELKIPLIFISTDYVFNGTGSTKWQPSDLTEPKNAYGRSKVSGEKLIRDSGVTHAILRTSWVVSETGQNFVKTMLRLSKSNQSLRIVVDQIGGPTPARDVASACVSISNQLIKNPKKSGTYHFTGKPETNWYDFTETIFKMADIQTKIIPTLTKNYATIAVRPLNSRMDCKLTESTFNLSQPSWSEGLKNILTKLKAL